MKSFKKIVKELIDKEEDFPFPLKVIPNNMGINLCNVDSIAWQKQEDGQLINLTIYFKPENKPKDKKGKK